MMGREGSCLATARERKGRRMVGTQRKQKVLYLFTQNSAKS